MELRTPRGMRDFSPSEMIARDAVFSTVKKAYERYGFYPLETPALESYDVLTAKCGDEVSKQVFRISDSDLGLRFDLTVPLSRYVAGNPSLAKPFKRYCISRVWRREEPQKGRFREFWQADVDIVGSPSMRCEAELLAAAVDALRELGFPRVVVKLNSRKILDAAVQALGIAEEKEFSVFRSLDKLEKIGAEAVKEELKAKGISAKEISAIMSFGEISGSNSEKIAAARKMLPDSQKAKDGLLELEQVISLFSEYDLSKGCELQVDFALVRGLDYYTGPIFEIAVPEGGIGSLAGGGRYDNLIALYGAQPTPATGISLGIERITELMKQKRASEKPVSTTSRVFIAPVKPEFYTYGLKLLQAFRSLGINSEIDLMERTLRKQLDYASSMGIQFAAIIGEKEKKEFKLTLRNLRDGKEQVLSPGDAASVVKSA